MSIIIPSSPMLNLQYNFCNIKISSFHKVSFGNITQSAKVEELTCPPGLLYNPVSQHCDERERRLVPEQGGTCTLVSWAKVTLNIWKYLASSLFQMEKEEEIIIIDVTGEITNDDGDNEVQVFMNKTTRNRSMKLHIKETNISLAIHKTEWFYWWKAKHGFLEILHIW